jgi:drug/metabolite transporter (DMT)-like permease
VSSKTRDFFLLHFIVFAWGWTAVLGKIITLPALQMIWIRVIMALVGIVGYAFFKKKSFFISKENILKLLLIGLLVGLHWICFYCAVKVSNVSVTLACFSTGTLFTAFIEPLFYKRRILFYEILFGAIVIGALLLIFNLETKYFWGIVLGVGAAFTSSLMAVVNSIMSRKNIDAEIISSYEMVGALASISFFVLLLEPQTATLFNVSLHDWVYLLLFIVFCTIIPFIIGIVILKNVSPYTLSLTLNLETIYGILFAYFIFGDTEEMSLTFYIGAAVILAVVCADAYMKSRKQ